jgi:hypothetical protein
MEEGGKENPFVNDRRTRSDKFVGRMAGETDLCTWLEPVGRRANGQGGAARRETEQAPAVTPNGAWWYLEIRRKFRRSDRCEEIW